ncbi:MAG: hypothetical protein ABIB46_05270 [bacterium]
MRHGLVEEYVTKNDPVRVYDAFVEALNLKELQNKETLKSKVKDIMNDLKAKDLTSINSTDSECVKEGRQGTHADYNAQIVVDEKHGLIVNDEVVNENNDVN